MLKISTYFDPKRDLTPIQTENMIQTILTLVEEFNYLQRFIPNNSLYKNIYSPEKLNMRLDFIRRYNDKRTAEEELGTINRALEEARIEKNQKERLGLIFNSKLSLYPWAENKNKEYDIDLYKPALEKTSLLGFQCNLICDQLSNISKVTKNPRFNKNSEYWFVDIEVSGPKEYSGASSFIYHHEHKFKTKEDAEKYLHAIMKFIDNNTLKELNDISGHGNLNMKKFKAARLKRARVINQLNY